MRRCISAPEGGLVSGCLGRCRLLADISPFEDVLYAASVPTTLGGAEPALLTGDSPALSAWGALSLTLA